MPVGAAHIAGMSSGSIPVLSNFRQSIIALPGSAPVRGWLGTGTDGTLKAVVAHTDLIQMVRQEPLLRLTFLPDGAVLSSVTEGALAPLPLVFLQGVGLKCYDLRNAGLPLYEAALLPSAA